MSTTFSPTQTKNIIPKTVSQIKMEDNKPARLVRSSSIDKIKRFNTYICSQQYYIIPAIIDGLKSSEHVGLPSSTENIILIFRSLIFNSFLYKFFLAKFKNVSSSGRFNISKKIAATTTEDVQSIISNFYDKFTNCFESTFLLLAAFYVGCFVIFSQILLCVYLLSFVVVPLGLIFLVACVSLSAHLCHRINSFYKKTSDIRNKVKCKKVKSN